MAASVLADGVDTGHVPKEDPRFSLSSWVHHVAQSVCELEYRRRGCPAVLRCDVVNVRPGMRWQDGVCLASV